MKLSQNQKNNLMNEIIKEFGLFTPLTIDKTHVPLLVKNIEYPPSPPVYLTNDKKITITFNKSQEYDYRIELINGSRLFVKIFVSPRNFKSWGPIIGRYKKFIEKNHPIIQSYAKITDLWILFVKTPEKWQYATVPLSEDQWILIKMCYERVHKKSRKIKILKKIREDLGISEDYPVFVRFLLTFIGLISYNKSNNGLSLY